MISPSRFYSEIQNDYLQHDNSRRFRPAELSIQEVDEANMAKQQTPTKLESIFKNPEENDEMSRTESKVWVDSNNNIMNENMA